MTFYRLCAWGLGVNAFLVPEKMGGPLLGLPVCGQDGCRPCSKMAAPRTGGQGAVGPSHLCCLTGNPRHQTLAHLYYTCLSPRENTRYLTYIRSSRSVQVWPKTWLKTGSRSNKKQVWVLQFICSCVGLGKCRKLVGDFVEFFCGFKENAQGRFLQSTKTIRLNLC